MPHTPILVHCPYLIFAWLFQPQGHMVWTPTLTTQNQKKKQGVHARKRTAVSSPRTGNTSIHITSRYPDPTFVFHTSGHRHTWGHVCVCLGGGAWEHDRRGQPQTRVLSALEHVPGKLTLSTHPATLCFSSTLTCPLHPATAHTPRQ